EALSCREICFVLHGVAKHLHYPLSFPKVPKPALIDPSGTIAEVMNGVQPMGNVEDGHASLSEAIHAVHTFLLESLIAYREHLIDDKNIWIRLGGYRKAKTSVHAR